MKGEKFSRTDSDAGVTGDLMRKPWTVDEVRTRALSLGKKFEPNRKIADQLESDLTSGKVIVLFTPEDVDSAITQGFISEQDKDELKNFVSPEGMNEIAVVPADNFEAQQSQRLIEWFLTNNRC